MCLIGFVRFARHCGKVYSRHLFPYGGIQSNIGQSINPEKNRNFALHNLDLGFLRELFLPEKSIINDKHDESILKTDILMKSLL